MEGARQSRLMTPDEGRPGQVEKDAAGRRFFSICSQSGHPGVISNKSITLRLALVMAVHSLFVQLRRSFAGTREHHVNILKSLGFRWRQQTLELANTPNVRGAVDKVGVEPLRLLGRGGLLRSPSRGGGGRDGWRAFSPYADMRSLSERGPVHVCRSSTWCQWRRTSCGSGDSRQRQQPRRSGRLCACSTSCGQQQVLANLR